MGDGQRGLSPSTRETLLLAGLAAAGVLVVALVLFGDALLGTPGWENYEDWRWDLLRESDWALWVALVVGQGALWGVLAPLLWRAHTGLPGPVHRRDLVLTVGLLAVITLGVDVARYSMRIDSPLPGHFGKATVVTWLGTFVALVAVAGMVRVGRAAWQLRVGDQVDEALASYLALRERLREFLFAAGAVIAGAVLAAGALQIAADGYAGQTRRTDFVLLYGLFLSTLLAAAYAPAFGSLREAGERVLEKLEPAPEEGEPDWPLGSERRRELRAYLEVDAGLFQSLRVGIAVLAPLLSGLVTLLLSGD
jgi:hypothetical protein